MAPRGDCARDGERRGDDDDDDSITPHAPRWATRAKAPPRALFSNIRAISANASRAAGDSRRVVGGETLGEEGVQIAVVVHV